LTNHRFVYISFKYILFFNQFFKFLKVILLEIYIREYVIYKIFKLGKSSLDKRETRGERNIVHLQSLRYLASHGRRKVLEWFRTFDTNLCDTNDDILFDRIFYVLPCN